MGKIIDIKINDFEVVKINIHENQSIDSLKEAITSFKETKEFETDNWNNESLFGHLQFCAIEFEEMCNYADETVDIRNL